MDKRVAKTKACIFDAFYQLLTKKSYAKITIQDIIEAANIGRSTFYVHFATKDDLLKALCQDLFDHVFCLTPEAEVSHDFSSFYGRIDLIIIHILYHLKDDAPKIKTILRCESCDLFWSYLEEQFNFLVTHYMLESIRKMPSFLPDSLLIAHISNSFIVLSKWWIQNGMLESPECIEHYFESLLFSLAH